MKNINLEVTVKEAELILASLQELPFKLSNELIINLANEQLQEIPQMEGTKEALDEL